MRHSDVISDLAASLVKAHAEISGVVKSATNPFFKSKYADLESVVEAVKPALLKQGIVIVQGLQDAENGVAVETMLLHSSGQWISSTLRLPASKEDAQGYGSACTYGRRYGLMAICGVPAEDDDGNAATATSNPEKPARRGNSSQAPRLAEPAERNDIALATPEQVEAMKKALAENGVDKLAFLMEAEVGDFGEIPATSVPKAITWIKKQRKAA
jgi:hypothetical protein